VLRHNTMPKFKSVELSAVSTARYYAVYEKRHTYSNKIFFYTLLVLLIHLSLCEGM